MWWNFGIWNRRSLPETNAAEWLAWRTLVSTLIMMLSILIFIKNCFPNNQSFRANKVGLRPPETEQKQTPLEERFIQIISRRMRFFTADPLWITSRNCLWYVSVHQNCLEPSPKHVEDVQNIEILSFLKTFYDRHCAPYKRNFSVFVIG